MQNQTTSFYEGLQESDAKASGSLFIAKTQYEFNMKVLQVLGQISLSCGVLLAMKLATDTKTAIRCEQFCLIRTLGGIARFVVVMHLLLHLVVYKACIFLVKEALYLTEKWSHKNVSQADCVSSILNSIVCIFFWYMLQLCAFIFIFYVVVFGLYYCKLVFFCQYQTL